MDSEKDDVLDSSRPLPDVIGGRYRIVSRLGIGGMGVVYKAIDLQLHRSVAVKALEERRLHLPGAALRLKTEALAAASLDHPYICKVYELVETATNTFIVMEYIEGETLSSMLKRGALKLLQTVQLGREIAEGLANAHSRGLVHRDVKPSNVMVTSHGHVKLLDFGVSGADVESTPKDVTRTLSPQLTVHAGTPQYMAPEQAAGQPITTRADLFSLGVVLYECITGKLPFSGSTTFDYVRHVLQSPPKRLDKIAPETPDDLVELIDRLLEKAPVDRPESAEAVVARLRQLEDSLVSPTGTFRTARQARTGRQWKTVALAAVGIAAIVIGWQVFWPQTRADDVLMQSRPFAHTSADESGSRISPDGQWASFIATASGGSRIMVQRLDGGEARPLTLGPGDPVDQVWSPDGSQIAVLVQLDNAWVIQVYPAFFGGAPSQSISLKADSNVIVLIRWIDREIYFRTDPKTQAGVRDVRRIALDSPGAEASVSEGWKIDGTLRTADIRPDGRAVISVIKGGHEDLWTLNVDGSALQQITADEFFDRNPHWIGSGDRVIFQSNRGGQVDLWQIDVRSKTMSALQSGEAEEVPESASADGKVVSFQQLTKDANLWLFDDGPAQQLTLDSLSDYSPVLSGDGRTLAFQRSQPTPSRGYTILDAKVFVSPFDGGPVIDPRSIADGFAPDLSSDGNWLAYLQTNDQPGRMSLSVRDLRAGGTILVSRTAELPSLSLTPVDWSARMTAWNRSGDQLFFVDKADGVVIRRYSAGKPGPGQPIWKAGADSYVRDVYVSPTTGRVGFISSSRDGVLVHEIDPASNTARALALAHLPPLQRGEGVVGRGWLDSRFLLLRSAQIHKDRSADLEVLLTDGKGGTTIAGRITNAFSSTARLHASRRTIYLTRADKGVHNVYAFSLDTGVLAAVTQNTLPGVTFSGFQPAGARGTLAAREERRADIWIIQQTATPRSGNQAGR